MDSSKFSKNVQPLYSTILDLPPSCVEFIPGFPEWFIVGTYNLQREVDTGSLPQSRTGSLNLLRIVGDDLTLVQTISHPSAILDLHFHHDSLNFGVVSSTGSISIYRFDWENHRILHVITHQVCDSSILILSFTWYEGLREEQSQSEPFLAITLSNGLVHLLRFSPDFKVLEILNDSDPINKHSLEAWTCAFAQTYNSGLGIGVYSGGDDGMLRLAEFESLPRAAGSQTPITYEFRGHEAGVTAILPLPIANASDSNVIRDDLLLTGSYDDHVRVYNAKNTRGRALAKLNIGGGVWRLKFLDFVSPRNTEALNGVRCRILASCMYAGARILEITRKEEDGEWKIEILASVTVHESMCYGCDVQPVKKEQVDEDRSRLCVSTSFYDRLLCLWRFDPKGVRI